MKEFYTVRCYERSGVYPNEQETRTTSKVLCESHIQRHPGSTSLNGLSKSGEKTIAELRKLGRVTVEVGGREVGIENQ